jgi:hypothetical protein
MPNNIEYALANDSVVNWPSLFGREQGANKGE